MAKTVYVDVNGGDDLNSGLSWGLAKKTILGARAATAAGDLVLIAPGVYPEATLNWNSANDAGVLYRKDPNQAGKVIVDFEQSGSVQASGGGGRPGHYWRLSDASTVSFMDMHFRNPIAGAAFFGVINGVGRNFIHCVFYQRDGAANTGVGITAYNSAGNESRVVNCSFYNLDKGLWEDAGTHYGNYFVSVTTAFHNPVGVNDYNAYPANAETNGINTSTGANPGFTSAATEDFTLDPVTIPADWATFQNSGFQGGSIGAWGNGGFYYDALLLQLRMFSPAPTFAQGNPQPAWENEGPNGTNTYTAGTPGDIIPNVGTGEPEIDLATTPAATGGRMRSEVFDLGAGTPLVRTMTYSGFEDLPGGAALDTDDALPLQQEYRSSATSFLKGDGTPTWNTFARGDNLNQAHRYFQMRVTFRTGHTNA